MSIDKYLQQQLFFFSGLHVFFPTVPSAPPNSVSVSDVTASTITIQWGRVNCSHHNGHLTGYSVRYGVQGYPHAQTVNVSRRSATTILNLTFLTTYEIEVAAMNSVGTGVFSPVITATTRPSEYISVGIIFAVFFTIEFISGIFFQVIALV